MRSLALEDHGARQRCELTEAGGRLRQRISVARDFGHRRRNYLAIDLDRRVVGIADSLDGLRERNARLRRRRSHCVVLAVDAIRDLTASTDSAYGDLARRLELPVAGVADREGPGGWCQLRDGGLRGRC